MARKQIIDEIIMEIEMAIGIRCESYYIGGSGYALQFPDNTLAYVRESEKDARINVNKPDEYKYIVLILAGNTYVGRLENGDLYCISNKSNGIAIKEGLGISEKNLNNSGFYAGANYDELIKLVGSIA